MSRLRRVRAVTLSLCVLMGAEAALMALDAIFPPDLSRAERSSPVALDRRGAWLRALPVENGRWRIRADLSRTDPSFLKRLVAVEDARFYLHPGVDPFAVVRAAGSALVHGRITSGASTLTMQTARLLSPHPRTFAGKAVEALRALQIEARLSKRRILALYLTLAPYGGNLEGVRAASLSYFGHEPESLTPGEQALLIALPQSPEARRPDRRPEAARAARREVLDKLVHAGQLSPAEAAEADAEPLPGRAPFPSLAWHVAGELARAAPKDQASVVSTIDAGLQRRLEPLARAAARAQGPGVTAAILVVDIDGRAVRAAVGSAGLDRPGGWIDMTTALRSPGSSLKPFIYAMAFEQGLMAPDTEIDDTPRRFADYQPENFDRVFHGKVTAREALTNSLNVPAVATLEKVGPAAFEARLTGAGVKLVRPRAQLREPGLALALGGVGISLRDLAALYAALGDGGLYKPLAFTEDAARAGKRARGVRLVRAEAAQQVLDILRETPPPAGVSPAALARGRPLMAFKTGTSYGFRDALAAGVIGHYAVVVWTGRADGGARGGLTGRDAALPLLFDAADLIDAPPSAPRPIAPKNAPEALERLQQTGDGPRLIFPPDGATVQVAGFGPGSRGLVLSAGGEGLTWYVAGEPVAPDPVSGRVIWRPASPGFYRLSVVDGQGREAAARVRIKAG
ncbi:penicillin-binding protein 1C [Phenylobacterium sp.]|uniref:penicillin-binding protein 1C n=1 Tax=Phenylobacterium sp. TaxID=1871053 RepID=UPI0035B3F2A9